MKTPSPVRWLQVVVALLALPLSCAAEPASPAFYDLTFAAAAKQAAAEQKILFIDFYTTWCAPCKMLDESTWQDAKVISLLHEKAVAVKIDAEKEKVIAQRYQVAAYPTLLLLKPDGTEIDRLIGYREAGQFIEEFTASLAGKTALIRAQDGVTNAVSDHDKVMTRYDLGRNLALQGKNEEALHEFLWCYDEGMVQVASFAGVRSSYLLSDIASLGNRFPPAKAALQERRDRAEAALLAGNPDRRAPMDFAALNRTLNEDARTLAFFDQLSPDDSRRDALGRVIFLQLLQARRYGDAVRARPYGDMWRLLSAMQMTEAQRDPAKVAPQLQRIQHDYQLRWFAEHLEALAGAGQLDNARKLLVKALDYDSSDEAKAVYRKGLGRAGHPELI